jgi:hypothetical protein
MCFKRSRDAILRDKRIHFSIPSRGNALQKIATMTKHHKVGSSFHPLAGNRALKEKSLRLIAAERLYRRSEVSIPLRGKALQKQKNKKLVLLPDLLFPSPCGERRYRKVRLRGLTQYEFQPSNRRTPSVIRENLEGTWKISA